MLHEVVVRINPGRLFSYDQYGGFVLELMCGHPISRYDKQWYIYHLVLSGSELHSVITV